MNLPTVIDSQKTIDKKTFYKTADICQMLICCEAEPEEIDEEQDAVKNKNDELISIRWTRNTYTTMGSPNFFLSVLGNLLSFEKLPEEEVSQDAHEDVREGSETSPSSRQ